MSGVRTLLGWLLSRLAVVFARVSRTCKHLSTTICTQLPDASNAHNISLHYFNTAGLAQAIRDTMRYGDVPFEDVRLTRTEFDEMEDLPFGQLPVLDTTDDDADGTRVVDTRIAQSKTILRYVGRLTHTYPTTTRLHMAKVDALLELHTEFMQPLVCTLHPERFGLTDWSDDKKTQQRAWCNATHVPRYLEYVKKALQDDADYLEGFALPTVADFAWAATLHWLKSGILHNVKVSPDVKIDAYLARIDKVLEEAVDKVEASSLAKKNT
jgi:glutathione S-transferase